MQKSELQKRVEANGRIYCSEFDTLYADAFRVGTSKYRGGAYFWAFEYRHHGLRGFTDINLHHSSLHKFRRDVHNEFLKNNLELAGVSELHEAIIDKHAVIAYAKGS